jgi:colicin import membrane protein
VKAPPKVDIALEKERAAKKAKEEAEKKAAEQKAAEKKAAEQKAAEKKATEQKAAAEKEREAKLRDQQRREDEARMRRELEQDSARVREDQLRRDQQAAKEEADRRAAEAKASAAAAAADNRARATWVDLIRAKIRGNVIAPDNLVGNPEAVFDVVQLPTGEVVSVRLRRSSGNRAYDDALERAIMKSSPLPQPPRRELFERQLELRFRPND